LQFGILGPLEVTAGASQIPLDAHLQRVLLAVLLCSPNRGVPTSVLQDALWAGQPPRTPGKVLQVYVHRLRRALGEPDRIQHGPAGYLLVVGQAELDAARFGELVTRAGEERMAGRPAQARELLREALALWRGTPFGDLGDVPALRSEVNRLSEQLLAAREESVDIEIELGRHAEAISEVADLVAAHPLRERLRAQLMLALYRAGRRAEALEVYDTGRRVMAEELGLDPGRELRDLHASILRAEPELDATPGAPNFVVVRQLPGDVAGFTGRADALKRLDELLPDSTSISVVTGTAGVGKTALAVHWAHHVADLFPDGQLYVNLRGFAPGRPMRPIEALARFLRALGISPEKVPLDAEEAADLYRSMLAQRKVLVLLDNAARVDQVRPLLPGGPGCRVVVTSRDRLAGLVAREGARRLTLDVLPLDEALTLLAGTLGAERVAAEPEAAAELCRLCACLPLALRIVAADLTDQPERSLAEQAQDLAAGNRLGKLQAEGDEETAVRAALDLSYATLGQDARRMFRLLGLVPGPDVSLDAAAALAGAAPAQAGELVQRLVSAHLIDRLGHDRFTFHDLLRLYASERAERDSAGEQQAATQRLYDHYLSTVDAAAQLLYPQILRLRPADIPAAAGFDDPGQALGWLDTERLNLVAAIVYAADHGPHSYAWLLADALRGYFFLRRHMTDWSAVANAGLNAAAHSGGVQEQAASHQNVGLVHTSEGQYAQAAADFTNALTLSQEAGWVDGEAAALGNLGNAYSELGRPRDAAAQYERALDIYRRTGRPAGQANCLLGLGNAHRELGLLASAFTHHTEALALYREMGTPLGEGRVLGTMGADLHELGRLTEAMDHFERAGDLLRAAGDRDGEATILIGHALNLCDAGRCAEALRQAESVLATTAETGDRLTEAAALTTAGRAEWHLGRFEDALQRHEEALGLARQIEYGLGEARALQGLAVVLTSLSRLDEAQARAHEALAVAERAGYQVFVGQALTALAQIHLARSEPDLAVEWAERALAVHHETGHRIGEELTEAVLAQALGTGRQRG
jgi:DNA-binding SARP family transcriptional activator